MKLAMRKGAVLLLLRLSAFLSSPISLGKRTYYLLYVDSPVDTGSNLIALSGRASFMVLRRVAETGFECIAFSRVICYLTKTLVVWQGRHGDRLCRLDRSHIW